MNPIFHSQLTCEARLWRDEAPVVASGVIQSMVTLGPAVMEPIVDQIRALFGRMVGRRRYTGVE